MQILSKTENFCKNTRTSGANKYRIQSCQDIQFYYSKLYEIVAAENKTDGEVPYLPLAK